VSLCDIVERELSVDTDDGEFCPLCVEFATLFGAFPSYSRPALASS
jgi:hypothetical protein